MIDIITNHVKKSEIKCSKSEIKCSKSEIK